MKNSIRIILSCSLLLFLFLQIDWQGFVYQISKENIVFFVLSIVLVLGQIFFLNLRWHEFLNTPKEKVPFTASVLMNVLGYFANVLFITSVGGIVAKSAMATRYGISVVQALFITFLDRFMTLFALLFFCALGLPFLLGTIDVQIGRMLALTIAVIIGGLSVCYVLIKSGVFNTYIMASYKRTRIAALARMFVTNNTLLTRTTVYSIIAQAFFIFSVYVLSFGVEPMHGRTLEFLALLPVLSLISSLPISFGGWGVREGAFMYGLGLIGFSMEGAFLLSVQVGLVGLVAPFLLGLRYYVTGDLSVFAKSMLPKPSKS